MSLIKSLLVVGIIVAIIAETPVIWKKLSQENRKQLVSWVPKALLPEEKKPNVEKVVDVSKQKPKVYESQGRHGEVEFSDGRSMTHNGHVRVLNDAKGVTLYTHAPDQKSD